MANVSKAKPEYLSMTLTTEEAGDINMLASLLGVRKATAAKIVIRQNIKPLIDRILNQVINPPGDIPHVQAG
jgi:hypothetical protein